ncbi:UNVERIFIED_CONTAM: hypothetical protein FKN15_068243 [Acipenser sinensis]
MWVVLFDDGIEFYKKKTDSSPKGMIPLKGGSISSLCQDFGKRMFVIKLSTGKKQDHFFQAAFLEERDAWIKDIKRAITCLEAGHKFARKSTRKSIRLSETVDLGALYIAMKNQDSGVKELKLEKDKRVFNYCFTAKKYDIEGNLFEIITSDETHYFLQAATPTERKEWIQAIQTVAKTGK